MNFDITEYLPTEDMLVDKFTKTLGPTQFIKLRDIVMGHQPIPATLSAWRPCPLRLTMTSLERHFCLPTLTFPAAVSCLLFTLTTSNTSASIRVIFSF